MERRDVEKILKYSLVKGKDSQTRYIGNTVRNLMENYSISLNDIVSDILFIYFDKNHVKKFSSRKNSASTFIINYIYWTLHNIERQYKHHGMVGRFNSATDACDWDVREVPKSMGRKSEEVEEMDFEKFLEFFCAEGWQKSETLFNILASFNTVDLAVMAGSLSADEAAKTLGISRQAYGKKLRIKKAEFNGTILQDEKS